MASIFNQNSEPEPVHERTPLQRTIDGVDSTSAAAPQLSFMLAGAQWRDSWLHGFRSLYLVMEVILLGLAGGPLVSRSHLTASTKTDWTVSLSHSARRAS